MDRIRKIVAITGSTGGLGRVICKDLAKDHDLIFVDRNIEKSKAHAENLKKEFPDTKTDFIECDLADIESVKNAVNALIGRHIDVLILNSGIYDVPVYKCATGYNNIFQVNFLSHYYMARRIAEENQTLEKVVAIGSVAHRYGRLDASDVDFSTRKKKSAIYGNSKRFLMFAFYEYFKGVDGVKLAVAHPGVTFTNMTDHYPKFIGGIVKACIKLACPPPKRAVRGIIAGARGSSTGYHVWIGPRFFDVWGKPKAARLTSCDTKESENIGRLADEMYRGLEN